MKSLVFCRGYSLLLQSYSSLARLISGVKTWKLTSNFPNRKISLIPAVIKPINEISSEGIESI